MTSRFIVRPLGLCAAALALAMTPAQALVVYDPTNYASNVLQAARALQRRVESAWMSSPHSRAASRASVR